MFDYYQGDWKCNGRKMLQMLKLQAQQNLIMFFAITCNKLNKIVWVLSTVCFLTGKIR